MHAVLRSREIWRYATVEGYVLGFHAKRCSSGKQIVVRGEHSSPRASAGEEGLGFRLHGLGFGASGGFELLLNEDGNLTDWNRRFGEDGLARWPHVG